MASHSPGGLPMHLNYLPLRFTSDVFKGGVLPLEGNPKNLATGESALSLKLRELRQALSRLSER
jgi:hypothetical protein